MVGQVRMVQVGTGLLCLAWVRMVQGEAGCHGGLGANGP